MYIINSFWLIHQMPPSAFGNANAMQCKSCITDTHSNSSLNSSRYASQLDICEQFLSDCAAEKAQLFTAKWFIIYSAAVI